MHRTIEYDVHCNWKLLFQNYSECYHCGPVHPALAKLTPPTSGENDLTEGPFTGGFMVINRGHREHDHEREVVRRGGRATCRRRTWIASTTTRSSPTCSSACTPTTSCSTPSGPRPPTARLIQCSWLFHPATLSDPTFKPDDGVEFWDMTNKQDWHICEQSQPGIQSRAYRPGPYSRRESLSVQFDREVLRSLGR